MQRRNPESPDYMGDMNPFWQTLDQVFGEYFNTTTPETSSYYTSFFHPVSLRPGNACNLYSQRGFAISLRTAMPTERGRLANLVMG